MIYRLISVIVIAGMLIGLPASSVAQQGDDHITVHVVQRGETLYRIAQMYGLSIDVIAQFNSIADPTNIQVGQRLLIPLAGASQKELPETHVVQAGETLKSIANLYGLTIEDLAVRNSIADMNRIYVGQILAISTSSIVTPSPIPTTIPVPSAVVDNTKPVIYTVKGGDTLFRIATRFGLTVNELARANKVDDPTLIFSGQQLIIPGVKPPELALDLPPNVTQFMIDPLVLVEGETGLFRVSTTSPATLSGTFLNQRLLAGVDNTGLINTVLVGIPMFTEAGVYPMALELADGTGNVTPITVNVQVVSGDYAKENITLSSSRAELLDPNVEAAELQTMRRLMSTFTATRYFDGPMSLPAAASISSPFGRKRSYNGGPFDHFHAGTDFAGAPGTPVMAAASGQVIFAGKLDVRGNTTIIDHGQGIFTVYCHQASQIVNVGDMVTTGQSIGTVGATGRVTGPHLHWEIWVNGIQVNPMQWVQESFS